MNAIFLPINMHIRHNIYHYRRRIPSDLVHLFGKKEVTKSLRSKNPINSVRLKNRLDGFLEQLFQACRLSAISQDEAQARLTAILTNRHSPPVAPAEGASVEIIPIPSRRRGGKRLSDAVDAYSSEKEHGWTSKTKKEFAAMYNKLITGLSDPYLQNLDRPALVAFRDSLAREGKHAKTVNKYLQTLSSVLRHASRLKWINGNPAEGLTLQDNRREDEIRRAFTPQEIATIFLALQRDKSSFYSANSHARYWLPLLGIYTGARVNELAQLDVTDIITEKDIPAIHITAVGDEEKRVKSESSRRYLPIHRDLLILGFMKYVQNIAAQGHTKLFPSLKIGPNGYSHYFVKQFAGPKGWLRSVLPGLPTGVAFHSFRHTVATMLKNAEEPERLIEELMGHKHASLTLGRYGKPYDITIRARAINAIEYNIVALPVESSELVDVGNDVLEPVSIITCGPHKIHVSYDEPTLPLTVRQYYRPDLHGYSIFHDAIPDFIPD
ncbi:MAG: site-specific integrase [Desulfuromonadales bacterium]